MSGINGLSMDSAVEQVMSLLGDDDGAESAAETPIENLSDEAKANRVVKELDKAEESPAESSEAKKPEAEPEPEAPAIDPPASWDADAKERFKALPPDLQTVVVERERERESAFGKTQREAAEAKKAAEAQLQAVTREREAYTAQLSQLIQMAKTMDPVLAEGAKTDWVRESQQDPAGTQAKWFAYQQRQAQLQALQQERDRVAALQAQEQLTRATESLSKELDFWGDEAKRSKFQGDLRAFLKTKSFGDDEIRAITDHRAILLARDAMLYRDLMAQQAKIGEHKKAPTPPKQILKSQAASDRSEKSDRVAAALKRVKSTGRLDEQAAVLASILD